MNHFLQRQRCVYYSSLTLIGVQPNSSDKDIYPTNVWSETYPPTLILFGYFIDNYIASAAIPVVPHLHNTQQYLYCHYGISKVPLYLISWKNYRI